MGPELRLPLIALIGLSQLCCRDQNPRTPVDDETRHPHPSGTDPSLPLTDRTLKSGPRPASARPSLGKTLELLETKLSGTHELPEESLEDRNSRINRLLRDAGIPPEKLRVVPREGLPPEFHSMRIEELRLSDPTVADVLKYTSGRTILAFRIRPGVIEWYLATDGTEEQRAGRPRPPYEDPFEDP